MKAKLNNPKIILWLLATSLFLSVSQTAFGQEIIREYYGARLCDTSIIRALGNDSVLIYNRIGNTTVFVMLSNGLVFSPIVNMDGLYVNDFEVFGKQVYFCGYRIVSGSKKAVFGGFLLGTFPNITLKYYELDACTELRKLDYYTVQEGAIYYDQEGHLIMTGTTTDTRSDVLVDRVVFNPSPAPVPVPYSTEMYFSNNEDESFDDVAVLDNYVVVSLRKKNEGNPVVDFWQFKIPTLLGYSIFSTGFNYLSVASPAPETPVILEHDVDDNYAAVYKVEGYSRMAVLLLDAINGGVRIVEIQGVDTVIYLPMDIKYNKTTQIYDILAQRNYYYGNAPDYVYTPMQIYHVTQGVIGNWATNGTGIYYPEDNVWSIDPTKSSQNFVASGDDRGFSKFYRYSSLITKKCPMEFEYPFAVGKLQKKPIETTIMPSSYQHDEIQVIKEEGSVLYEIKCE